MGILEDAIREHLELKRRAGADPGEVARQEREALSPATRDVTADTATAEPLPVADGATFVMPPELSVEETLAASPFDDSATAVAPDPTAPEVDGEPPAPFDFPFDPPPQAPPDEAVAAAEPEAPAPVTREAEPPPPPPEPAAEVAPAPEAAPPEPPPAAEPAPDDTKETAVFDAAAMFGDEPAAEPAPPATDDVLEETPDFLQETPDHERLWFEQKPPKDFDF